MNVCTKLKCLSLPSFSSLVYCLYVRLGAYPRVERLKGNKNDHEATVLFIWGQCYKTFLS